MNNLIKIEVNENQEQLVSGRELHEFLEIGTQYTKWFERMCEYGFVENTDYISISQKRLTAQGNETEYIDHAIKLDMAKEIAMIQRSEKGKQARQYFIEVEKKFKQQALNTQALSPQLQLLINTELEQKQIRKGLDIINKRLDVLEKKPYRTHKMIETFEDGRIVRRHEIVERAEGPGLLPTTEEPVLYTITEIAGRYGLLGAELNLKLKRGGIQYKRSGRWKLCSKYEGKGYKVRCGKGNYKWTEKGKSFIESVLES